MNSHTNNHSVIIYLSAQDGENFSTPEALFCISISGASIARQLNSLRVASMSPKNVSTTQNILSQNGSGRYLCVFTY